VELLLFVINRNSSLFHLHEILIPKAIQLLS